MFGAWQQWNNYCLSGLPHCSKIICPIFRGDFDAQRVCLSKLQLPIGRLSPDSRRPRTRRVSRLRYCSRQRVAVPAYGRGVGPSQRYDDHRLLMRYFGGAAGASRARSDFLSLYTRFCSRVGACPVVSVRPRFSCNSPVRLPSFSSLIFLRSAAPAPSCSAPLVVTAGDARLIDPSLV
jgi:hypothetical protein